MKKVSLALGLVIVVLGCAVVYYVATMDVPVVATEHGEHGEEEQGNEHAHSEGEHSGEDHSGHQHDDPSEKDHVEEEHVGHDHEEGDNHPEEGQSDDHGHEDGASILRFTDNVRLLEGLTASGCLPATDAATLTQAYLAFRARAHAQALQGEQAVVPEDEALARLREDVTALPG